RRRECIRTSGVVAPGKRRVARRERERVGNARGVGVDRLGERLQGEAPGDQVGVACGFAMTRASALCNLPAGALLGDASGAALAFRGIPYARPPLAALRFAPPAPPDPWTG